MCLATMGDLLPTLLLVVALGLHSQGCTAVAAAVTTAKLPKNSAAQLLESLQQHGYLSAADAAAARRKFASLLTGGEAQGSSWSIAGFVSLANFVKFVAVALLLASFWSLVLSIAERVWKVFARVPIEVWQGLFCSLSVAGLLSAPLLAPHTMFIAVFCAFANLISFGWIVCSHPQALKWVEEASNWLEKHGPVSLECIISFVLAMYFGALTFLFSTEVFGFFTVVCVSAMTSFCMSYNSRTLTLWLRRSLLDYVIFGNLIVVVIHVALELTGAFPQQVRLFKKGVNFYCTFAIGLGFLVGASPMAYVWHEIEEHERTLEEDKVEPKGGKTRSKQKFMQHPSVYLLLFIIVLSAAMMLYFFGGVKSVGSILCMYAVLLVLEWIGMYVYRAGFIVGMAALGSALYGGVWLLERSPVLEWLSQNLAD
jgi:hypothetical protein